MNSSLAPETTSSEGAPRRPLAFASPKVIRFLAGGVLLVGVIAAVWGVAYAINGATQAKGFIKVPVQSSNYVHFDNHDVPASAAKIPEDVSIRTSSTDMTLQVWGSTVWEQLISRADGAVLGICLGVGGFLANRLLLSIAEGRPFQSGNALRIANIGGLVVVASLARDIFPVIGSNLVLDRVGLSGANSPVNASFQLSLIPLLCVPLILVLAEAFRRGSLLARDVEGLV